jgi:hypothetical protein
MANNHSSRKMKYDVEKHHRRSIRLRGYDYSSPGAYFITICTHSWECLFGDVVDREMVLNARGKIVRQCWLDIPKPKTLLDNKIIINFLVSIY